MAAPPIVPQYAASDYAQALANLLPRGPAWSRDPGSNLMALAGGLAPAFQRSGAAAAQLMLDASPATTLNLLIEWEETLGLPDACTPASPTIPQRQASVLAKFIERGSLSPEYFVAVAASLGYTAAIIEFTPFAAGTGMAGAPIYGPAWAFAWRVSVAGVASAPELVCRISKNAPAETIVFFTYP